MQICNALSVDVEDYFQTEACSQAVARSQWPSMPSRVQANTERLFQLFEEFGVRGTFFFLGWVAERLPGLVRQAAALGHEIGCHSYWHHPLYRLSAAEFREDTVRAKRAIEDAGGVAVHGYRAPSFSLVPGTEWAADILAELGFRYDSSVNPIHHDLYNNARAERRPHRIGQSALVELPIATARILAINLPVGGGGYLRMLPFAYIARGIEHVNRREGRAALIYLHPWEIDVEQPRLKLAFKSSLRQYTGLRSMESKLRRLLLRFKFASVREALRRELEPSMEPRQAATWSRAEEHAIHHA